MFERETDEEMKMRWIEEKEEMKMRWKKQDEVFPKALLIGCLYWVFLFPVALVLRILIGVPLWYVIEAQLIEEKEEKTKKETNEK